MALSNDLPGMPFIRAKGYTPGRPDGPPLWIVWHTMEVDELPDRAEWTARYFANPGDGRDVSSNWCIDNNSAVQTVDEDDSAWTVGNRPGNYRGVNLELAGRANQIRGQWLDAYGVGLFAQAAKVAANAMHRWGIPNRWCSLDDLRARRRGHTTHRDLGAVFGGSDHTDPGPNFPRDYVLHVVQAELQPTPPPPPPTEQEDDMTPYQAWAQHVINYRLEGIQQQRNPIVIPEFHDGETLHAQVEETNPLAVQLSELKATLGQILARPAVQPTPIDVDSLRAALLQLLTPADADATTTTPA